MPDVEHVIGLRTEVAEDAQAVADSSERQVDGRSEDACRIVTGSREARVGEADSARYGADGKRASNDLERALATRAMIKQLLARNFDEIAVPPSESGWRYVACMLRCYGFHVPLTFLADYTPSCGPPTSCSALAQWR